MQKEAGKGPDLKTEFTDESLFFMFLQFSLTTSSGVNKSQQHQEKISWERRESNLGLLDEKQV